MVSDMVGVFTYNLKFLSKYVKIIRSRLDNLILDKLYRFSTYKLSIVLL